MNNDATVGTMSHYRTEMSRCAVVVLLLGALVVLAPRAMAQRVFDVGRGRPDRVIATFNEADPLPRIEQAGGSTGMVGRLAGVAAVLVTAAEIQKVYSCLGPDSQAARTRSALDDGEERQYVLHLYRGSSVRRVDIRRTTDGQYYAQPLDAESPGGSLGGPVRLRAEQVCTLIGAWPAYQGGFEALDRDARCGELVELTAPLSLGRVSIDKATYAARFNAGKPKNIQPASRILGHDAMYVRLPKGYSPSRPAGLVIWNDPSDSGRPPDAFDAALDKLGLIVVGFGGAGNRQQVANRFQPAFDALETVSRRYHIDPRRVYLTGVSGGGRIASRLQGGFPDVFAGCVPIVGLDIYEDIPTIHPGRFWRKGYERPEPARFTLLRSRRIAPMTGPKDGNYAEIVAAMEILKRDSLSVRLFDIPGMGHELPPEPQLVDALTYIDEPYRIVHEKEAGDAAELLRAYGGDSPGPPQNDAQRQNLLKITQTGPWTDAGWRAARLLTGPSPTPASSPGSP